METEILVGSKIVRLSRKTFRKSVRFGKKIREGTIYVIYKEGRWGTKRETSRHFDRFFYDRELAIKYAMNIAKHAIVIYNEKGVLVRRILLSCTKCFNKELLKSEDTVVCAKCGKQLT